METNNIDKIVSDSLESRTIKPSNSSWERLSNQLDIAQEKKRKNWFLYVGYAASVLLVVSVAFFMNTNNGIETIIPEKIVTSPIIDTTKFVKPTLNNTIPTETVIVKNDKAEDDKSQKNTILKKKKPQIKHAKIIEKNPIVIAENITDIKKETKNPLQQNRIIIDSNLLLKSVDQQKRKLQKRKLIFQKKERNIFRKVA